MRDENIRTVPLTARVVAEDGVRFAAMAQTPQQLCAEVVTYICGRYDDVLWPAQAREVRALLEAGKPVAAIATYFASVGQRWDRERLELGGLTFGL